MNHTCLCLPSQSWSSFTDPRGMGGWVGLGTTTVNNQSAQECYVLGITVVNYSVTPHRATEAQQLWVLNSWSLMPWAVKLTTESPYYYYYSCYYIDTFRSRSKQEVLRQGSAQSAASSARFDEVLTLSGMESRAKERTADMLQSWSET